MFEPIKVTWKICWEDQHERKHEITCGESNGYWSENLNKSWNFSPSYNVPGAPSISIRILTKPMHNMINDERQKCLLSHIGKIIHNLTRRKPKWNVYSKNKPTCPELDFPLAIWVLSSDVFERDQTKQTRRHFHSINFHRRYEPPSIRAKNIVLEQSSIAIKRTHAHAGDICYNLII